jgi:DNA-binding NtrC family response regulator
VLAANPPAQALRLAGEHAGAIDLLITDVVMPGMNGRELAERITAMKPGLRCLYMSGYTADVIAHRGVLDEGMRFIQKPFSIDEMARKVREALGGT